MTGSEDCRRLYVEVPSKHKPELAHINTMVRSVYAEPQVYHKCLCKSTRQTPTSNWAGCSFSSMHA